MSHYTQLDLLRKAQPSLCAQVEDLIRMGKTTEEIKRLCAVSGNTVRAIRTTLKTK